MAKALQCPACGHKHALDGLQGTPTFPCASCGRTLRTPDEYVRPAGAVPRPAPAVPPIAPAVPRTGRPAARPTPSVAGPRRARERLALPVRIGMWVAAVFAGLLVTWLGAVAIGFLSKARLVDMFSSSRPGNYVRLFVLAPVWALVSATLATLCIEGWSRYRARTRADSGAGRLRAPSSPQRGILVVGAGRGAPRRAPRFGAPTCAGSAVAHPPSRAHALGPWSLGRDSSGSSRS